MFEFKVVKKSRADLSRRGVIRTSHGDIETPVFMPCATRGTVKGISMAELEEMDYKIILGNTYHLYFRPGDKAIKKMGGLHQFINWPKAILTDSGGYQVFSLGAGAREDLGEQGRLLKLTEEGATFRSPLDGEITVFTPEKVIEIQQNLGSDIAMVLDVCTEYPANRSRAEAAMRMTHLWADRSIKHWQQCANDNQALFGIIQGSVYQDLRLESTRYISSLDFPGIAVGGVSVGEGKANMGKVMKWVGPELPLDKPHYLMGIGEPEDILKAVKYGFDMFDSVLPTRLGRHGTVWVTGDWERFQKMSLKNAAYKNDSNILMSGCRCPACQAGYSRAYLSHLMREHEILGLRLLSLHNLHILAELMHKIREQMS